VLLLSALTGALSGFGWVTSGGSGVVVSPAGGLRVSTLRGAGSVLGVDMGDGSGATLRAAWESLALFRDAASAEAGPERFAIRLEGDSASVLMVDLFAIRFAAIWFALSVWRLHFM